VAVPGIGVGVAPIGREFVGALVGGGTGMNDAAGVGSVTADSGVVGGGVAPMSATTSTSEAMRAIMVRALP
jgi:hypothetical protein